MNNRTYRGKATEGDIWFYGSLLEQEAPLQCFGPKDSSEFYICKSGFADWNMPRTMDYILVHQDTIGQCTGLKDKDGKTIYEGDVYQVALNRMYEVRYCTGGESNFEWYGGCFILYANEETFFPFDKWAIDEGRVIGNIFDQPELLNSY